MLNRLTRGILQANYYNTGMVLRVATRRSLALCNLKGPTRVATRRNASAMAVPTSSSPDETRSDISVRILRF